MIKILTRHGHTCNAIIEDGSTKITIDLAEIKKGTWQVDPSIFDELITAAFEVSRFNGESDVNAVHAIFAAFLNDGEQKQLLELIKEKEVQP